MRKILYCALIAFSTMSCAPIYSIRGNITCYSVVCSGSFGGGMSGGGGAEGHF